MTIVSEIEHVQVFKINIKNKQNETQCRRHWVRRHQQE